MHRSRSSARTDSCACLSCMLFTLRWLQDCHKKVAAMQRFGIVPPHMAGYHLYRGSWWGTAEGNPNSHDDKVGDAASEGT